MASQSQVSSASSGERIVRLPPKLKFLTQPSRYKVLYGGRGGAKSWNIARALLLKGAERPLRILCTREVQRTIADSVHQLLKDQIGLIGLEWFYKVTEAGIEGRNGTQFIFAGIRQQDVGKLKSLEGVDICWVEEAQVVTKKSWEVLIPTIRKDDSEIWISFNPELDSDSTYQRFVLNPPKDAIVCEIGWRDNPWFPEVLRKEMEDLKARDPKAHEHVWEGRCRATVEGAIFQPEIEDLYKEPRRVRAVPYDPMLKVHTVWDLGWNDATAILFVQRLHSEVRIFNYWEGSFRKISDWVADLKDLRYNWGTDWLPHDGAQTRIEVGQSVQKIMQQLGRNAQIIPKMDPEQSIKLARMVFPRCYFDETNTAELLNRLKRYRRRLNQATQSFEAPLHDDASHGSDGFRYMCQKIEEMTNDDWRAMKPLVYPSLGTA